MIDWSGEDLSSDKDGSIERLQITPGKDYVTPRETSLVNSMNDIKILYNIYISK